MNSKRQKNIFILFIPPIFILVLVLLVNQLYDIRIVSMTRDVSALGNIHPFSGFLSSLGIVLWTVTASISLFSSLLFKDILKNVKSRFLLFSAIISSYLLFDDLFLLHELFGGYLFKGEIFVYFVLGITVFSYLILYRSVIFKTNYLILIFGLSFLITSVVVDSIQPFLWEKGDMHALLEDGTKWFGIFFWCSYYIETSYKFLSDMMIQTKNTKKEISI